jgi:hypothetical protein
MEQALQHSVKYCDTNPERFSADFIRNTFSDQPACEFAAQHDASRRRCL